MVGTKLGHHGTGHHGTKHDDTGHHGTTDQAHHDADVHAVRVGVRARVRVRISGGLAWRPPGVTS